MNNTFQRKATLLVCVYNKKETVENCIKSMLVQTFADARLLVIDNMSSDGSYEILKTFGDRIELIRLAGGYSHILNWAIDNCGTEFLAMTDSDCVLDQNWLSELLKAFGDGAPEEIIVATAGWCGTPQDVSLLQRMIGYEMDNRFDRMPKYIYRAPTMSLCLRTEFTKKVKFDETQKVAVETDFGFRLSRLGKIIYTKKAKVWHYHRSSLPKYFRQLRDQAKWAFRLIFRHKKKAVSDPITTLSMTAQIPLFFFGFIFLLLSLFLKVFFYPALILLSALFFLYIKNIWEINPAPRFWPVFIPFFLYRTLAWVVGVILGSPIAIKFIFNPNRKLQ